MNRPYPIRIALTATTLLATVGCHSDVGIELPSSTKPAKSTLISQITPRASLAIKSPDITADQSIADRFSGYGANQVPTIQWSEAPAGTKTLILLLEDPDAPGAAPFRHWMVYDIPARTTSVGATLPAGAVADRNDADRIGYFGPQPPAGDPPHHYHFEVFAIDSRMALAPKADQKVLAAVLKGHTLAAGELVATYQKP